MIRVNQIKLPVQHSKQDLTKKVSSLLHIQTYDIVSLTIKKRSIDARRKPELYYLYQVDVAVKNEQKLLKKLPKDCSLAQDVVYQTPACDHYVFKKRPVIVGAGPAGLFCAYILCLCGINAIVIERGQSVDQRVKDIENFWENGTLLPNSNVQFGEGGAGTFSDGKLNTLVKDKSGKNRFVLETFVRFGAPEQILYEAKPHIGTDILRDVIRNMRQFMEDKGVDFLFGTQMTDLLIKDTRVSGLRVESGDLIETDTICLAIGHSARDTFEMLHQRNLYMEPKSFAVGFRVEHPRRFIDYSQYGLEEHTSLPAAAYKLTAQTSKGRGVYTFCMCPGGYVVNASSEEGRLAVNGMSYSGRNGDNSNSAIIVTVTPEDFESNHPLAGIAFQRKLEENAYRIGQGQVPVERFENFEEAIRITQKDFDQKQPNKREISTTRFADISPNIKGQYTFANVHEILPMELNEAFVEAMHDFGHKIKGYDSPDCLVSGVESRTSSPVRISRAEDGCSVSLKGLFPCGEGAGYAGGIMSAAMDGITIAEKMIDYAKGAMK